MSTDWHGARISYIQHIYKNNNNNNNKTHTHKIIVSFFSFHFHETRQEAGT